MLPVFVMGDEEMPSVDIVRIEWCDANAQPGWFPEAPDRVLLPCISVGYLVKETKAAITISDTVNAFGMFGGLFSIPAGMIQKKTTLVKAKLRAQKGSK